MVSRKKFNPIQGYKCLACRHEAPWGPTLYGCPHCNQNMEIVLDLEALSTKINRETFARSRLPGHWRFLPVLPLDTPPPVLSRRSHARSPLASVGATPLYRSRGLESRVGVGPIYLKDEGRNPSGSLKDRASSLVLARGLEEGARVVACATMGNAGASLACMGASSGVPTVIFMPAATPRAKVAQLQAFGARVLMVEGNYDACFDLCTTVSRQLSWFNRNTGINPVTREGKKTCAYEIALELSYDVPDLVIVSAGDGNILSGLAKGFVELHELGLTNRIPKMVAVQSVGSNAIAQAYREQRPVRAVKAQTLADSIAVDLPRDGLGALVALQRTEGFPLEVTDQEILEAIGILGREEGVFAEPAAAAAVAGLSSLVKQGRLKNDRSVALVITGSGLKDADAALAAFPPPRTVGASVEAVRELLGSLPEFKEGL